MQYKFSVAHWSCFFFFFFKVLSEALTVLERMKHRGACGFEENCGDGAGVMTGIPHAFYQRVIQ